MNAIDRKYADDPESWREARKIVLAKVGEKYANLRDEFADLISDFEVSDDPDRRMLGEWYEIFQSPDVRDPETEEVNFDAMEAKINDFEAKYGPEGMAYIERNTGFYRSPKEKEYAQDSPQLRDYWDIADDVFFKASRRYSELRQFDSYAEASLEADNNPRFRSSTGWKYLRSAVEEAHSKYLDRHPGIRKLLIKWGYRNPRLEDVA